MLLCDSCFHANTCINFCVGEGGYKIPGCQYYDNADHVRDLLAAEKDGRLVVLAKHGNYPFCCAEEIVKALKGELK